MINFNIQSPYAFQRGVGVKHASNKAKRKPVVQKLNLNKSYILYLRPRGDLGKEIGSYWNKVKGSNLSHHAVKVYPPHCTLTGFFSTSRSQKQLIKGLHKAFDQTAKIPHRIGVKKLVQGKKLHYIKLQSNYLKKISQAFATNIDLNNNKLKASGKGYHITLCDHYFKIGKKRKKIKQLEKKIDLHAQAKWSVCLYKKNNKTNKLSLVKELNL